MDQIYSLNLKVEYNNVKILVHVPDNRIAVENLIQIIKQQLIQSGNNIELNEFVLNDRDGFLLPNQEHVKNLLKDGDFVKLIVSQQKPDVQQQVALADPDEILIFLYDTSGSMGAKIDQEGLTRIGAVNAYFSAIADKIMAYEYNFMVKLVCFSSTVVDRCDYIRNIDQFISLVDNVGAGGGTACYDAIKYAIESLKEIKTKFPNAILRLIALTDGEDTSSKEKPETLIKDIIQNEIVLDSFVVGNQCQGLKQLTHASGGRCYLLQDLAQGLTLFENKLIISVKERPELVVENLGVLVDRPFDSDGLLQTQQNAQNIQKIKTQAVAKASDLAKQVESAKLGGAGAGAKSRVIKELTTIATYTIYQNQYKVYPLADDIFVWKAIIIAPKDSAFSGGAFFLQINLPQDYPFREPKFKFLSPTYHYNINGQGQFCQQGFFDWSPALTIEKIMQCIITFLSHPNKDNALDSNIATEYQVDLELYKQKARKHTDDFNLANPDKFLEFILGDQADKTTDDYKKLHQEMVEWIGIWA